MDHHGQGHPHALPLGLNADLIGLDRVGLYFHGEQTSPHVHSAATGEAVTQVPATASNIRLAINSRDNFPSV